MLPSFSQFCDYHYSKSLLQFITVDAHRETDVKIHFVEYDEFNQQDQDPAAAASVAASKLRHEPLVLGFGKRPTGSIHEQLHELVWRAGLRLRCIISLSYAICSEQSTTREGNHCARSIGCHRHQQQNPRRMRTPLHQEPRGQSRTSFSARLCAALSTSSGVCAVLGLRQRRQQS
jgi:hypothetical protein